MTVEEFLNITGGTLAYDTDEQEWTIDVQDQHFEWSTLEDVFEMALNWAVAKAAER